LKRTVTMKGSFIDSLEEYVLRECLNVMFPECSIEIRSDPSVNSPDEEMPISSVLAQKV
jgi:hypothetical protein